MTFHPHRVHPWELSCPSFSDTLSSAEFMVNTWKTQFSLWGQLSDLGVKFGRCFSFCRYIAFLARGKCLLILFMGPSGSSVPLPAATFSTLVLGYICDGVTETKITKNNVKKKNYGFRQRSFPKSCYLHFILEEIQTLALRLQTSHFSSTRSRLTQSLWSREIARLRRNEAQS